MQVCGFNRHERQGRAPKAARQPARRWLTALTVILFLAVSGSAYAACVNPAAPVGTLLYNSAQNVPQYCDDVNWIAMAPLGGFDVAATDFDGVSYMSASSLSGVQNSKKFTGSLWFRTSATIPFARYLLTMRTSADDLVFWLEILNSTDLRLRAVSPSDTIILNTSYGTALNDGKWHHVVFSYDMGTYNLGQVWIDDVDESSVGTYIDDTINFASVGDVSIGEFDPGYVDDTWDGDMAEVWFETDLYIDLSVEANRRKFIQANGRPASLGKSGELPTGSAPDIYLSGDAADFLQNRGTGGGFTVNGALADAATSPDDALIAPVWLGSLADATNLNGAVDVAVRGDYAYVVANDGDRLTVVDVSDPTAPAVAGSVTSAQLDGAGRVFIRYPYAFVTVTNANRFTVVDISNPASPSVAASIQDNLRLDGAIDLEVKGNYAYVGAMDSDYFTILDVSSPLSPVIVGSITSALLDLPIDFDIVNNYAYVGAELGDMLTVVDISNPASPSIAGSVTDANLDRPVGVTVVYPYAYVSAHDLDRITVVDISDPANPVVVGGTSDPIDLNGPRLSKAAGDYLYVANVVSDSLAIVDISNPLAPVVLDDTGSTPILDWGWEVELSNGLAYVTARFGDNMAIMRINGCADPAGVRGQLHYNADTHTPVYCDGDNWVALAPENVTGCPNVGDICKDGSIYAGLSPDGQARMYTTRCDGGQVWDGSSCTGTRTSLTWGYDSTLVGAESYTDGDGNTAMLGASPAASSCAGLSVSDRSDWYLPARDELNVLWLNRASIKNFDEADTHWYWTSTEAGATRAWKQRFSINGYQEWNTLKTETHDFRCVRKGPRRGLLSDPSLIAHWPLNESSGTVAEDFAGSNYGTASGGLTFNSSGGVIAGAALLDGVDDYIQVANNPNFSALPVTVSLWIRPEDLPTVVGSSYQLLVNFHPVSNWNSWRLYASSTGTPDHLVLEVTNAANNAQTWTASDNPLTADTWHHVVFAVDAAGTTSMYVNNVLQADSQANAGMLASTGSLNIGRNPNNSGFFPGMMDDIRIYSRVLTAAEIDKIYQAGMLGLAAQDCTLPNAAEGAMLYNTDADAIQYCDGANWVKLGKR